MGYFTALAYALGSLVCHQIPERSFHVAGVQLPVCARCTGLYAGALAGLLIVAGAGALRDWSLLSAPRARRALAIAALPTALTVGTASMAWWDPPNALRAVLAAPLGAVVGAIVSEALLRRVG